MARWIFSRAGSLVLVEAEHTIIQSVLARVFPYVDGRAVDGEPPCGLWTIQAHRLLDAISSDGQQPERLSYEKPFVSMNPDKKLLIVEEATEALVVQRVIRLLRNLFRLLLAAEAIFVHGGMVDIAGKGVAFLGPKYAGKTSLLLALLAQVSSAFVENDSLSLHLGKRPYGRGWFRSIYIRRDSFTTLDMPLLEKPTAFRSVEHAQAKPSLSPQSFATTFGCSLLPQADLHLIVFPSFLPRETPPTFSLWPLSKEDALIMLQENMVPVPNEYHQFLRPCFPVPQNIQLLEQLVEHVPCYRLQQSFLALAPAARAVIALTHGVSPCASAG